MTDPSIYAFAFSLHPEHSVVLRTIQQVVWVALVSLLLNLSISGCVCERAYVCMCLCILLIASKRRC